MSMPRWIENTLEHEHVDFRPRYHPPCFTAQQVAEEEHFSGHRVAKVVIVMAAGRPVEVVLPACERVDLEAVRKSLGCTHCRLAVEKEMDSLFDDCEVGTAPPLRHWPDVDILLDRHLPHSGPILFQAGTHQDAIEMQFVDWYRITRPQEGNFAIKKLAN